MRPESGNVIRLTVLLDPAWLEQPDGPLLDGDRAGAEAVARWGGAKRSHLWAVERHGYLKRTLPYRFVATFEWDNWQSFERGFLRSPVQRAIRRVFGSLAGSVYFVSEVESSSRREGGGS